MSNHLHDDLNRVMLELGNQLGFYSRRTEDGTVLCVIDGCTGTAELPSCWCAWHKSVGGNPPKPPETNAQRAFRLRVNAVHASLVRAGKRTTRAEAETLVREQINRERQPAAAAQKDRSTP